MRALILTLAPVVLAGCLFSSDVRLGPEANGDGITMKTGQNLVIELPAGTAPGQRWRQLQGNDYCLRLVEREADTQRMILTYEAMETGPVTLLLALQRETAAGPETERVFTLDVFIR